MLHRNVEASSTYVDDRLSHEEPKSRMQKLRSGGDTEEVRQQSVRPGGLELGSVAPGP